MTRLVVQGISKRYGAGAAALDGIDLSVASASRTAVVGPSGSGKSTLLRVIAGFEAADAGRVVLGGRVLADGAAAVPAHRRGIGYVPQEGALFPHLSVADNIGFGLGRGTPGRAGRIEALMAMVELGPVTRARRPHELSGGQQQRVALARALARQPSLMLLDEPFSALDTGLRESVRRMVSRALRTAGVTTILVTHDQAEAMSFADQVAVLRDGRLVQQGPPHELYLRPADRETAVFLGEAVVLPAELGDGWADCALGRVAADTAGWGAGRGAGRAQQAEVLLRPEHIVLTPVPPGEAADGADGCYGRVVAVGFGGSFCDVEVELTPRGSAGGGTRLLVRSASIDAPAAGGLVRVTTRGRAHVLGAANLR